ncbi:phosphoserine phosphatase SerB [Saccharophagus degradans]|uniref:Phosphoserine phosphatase n=1 Tax=Saccharophagus degradans (strain 2-40 / ATCC 43961 / DSM 17024) TaxID=203122 RepID=Q21LU2_SACD2|nr:phosphoserine phosphatase SerB [Saccharophagus degradans]ABD80337.1 methyl-accepting chemotaxis sensory transducer / phosphoserine phosphatase [Saccharophagus degradans 2-40]
MRELILINISGHDKPAVTSAVTRILAQNGANVLDIGQAVIHDQLSLGMLVEFNSGSNAEPVLAAIEAKMAELEMRVRFNPIDQGSYQGWVQQQGKPRHIVTLLARHITAEQIAELTHVVAAHGLNIDNISRLSGRVSLEHDNDKTKACVEFSARGTPADISKLRADFADLASKLDVDIAFQQDNMFRRTRRLVCFDMDSTLIEAEVIDELAKAAGVGDEVIAITEAAMRGELDFKESFTRRMALLKGLDVSVLESIAATLPITEGAEHLISSLRKLGYKTAILSGGFNYFGQYLQSKLGIDYVFANALEVVDGKVTGRVTGQIVDGARKAELLRELAAKEQISLEQVVAVGDGANDLPMLSIAGLGIAFRAKPLVKAEAKQAISTLGLDAILYLMGFRDREINEA